MTEQLSGSKGFPFDISSFGLHIIAMAFMLCDHLWATVVPGAMWLTYIGRLTFPIFAFMIAEGYYYTSDFKKYLKRMLIFAVIAEIPFNLTYSASIVFPFHQNVMWTFALSLVCLRTLDKIRAKFGLVLQVILGVLAVGAFMIIAQLLMLDYYGQGLLMVVVFYIFRGNKWYDYLGQLLALAYINVEMIGGMFIPLDLFGTPIELPVQAFAVLALIFIWWYDGRQGPHSKAIQYGFYAFYPVHMLILGLLSM